MKVNVKYFASIREAVGQGSETVETKAATCAALRDELIARGGAYAQALARGKAVRVALDHVMTPEAAELRDGSEVAFFPPVTGG
ncbi:MAG TPA: molybdopterin converting factor subunit 1 [Ramlibacter sp.]